MAPYQQRVIDEKHDLDAKVKSLQAFADTETFISLDPQEQARLHLQFYLMRGYSDVLSERIEAFPLAHPSKEQP